VKKFTIGVVGLGLMGGSLAAAFKKIDDYRIIGFDISLKVIESAKQKGIIDEGYISNNKLNKADVVFICLYPKKVVEFVKINKNYFKNSAIITDIAGIKYGIMKDIEKVLRKDLEFIGGHPMVGKEKEGIEFADANLFKNSKYILTPRKNTDIRKYRLLEELLYEIGVLNINLLEAVEHDEYVAYTSQLPHALATLLMNNNEKAIDQKIHGGSFKDATRVAMINAELWIELFEENKYALSKTLDDFEKAIRDMKNCVQNGDKEKLHNLFTKGREKREALR